MNESNTMTAADVRRFPIPENIEVLWLFDSDAYLKAHHTYRAAKAGEQRQGDGSAMERAANLQTQTMTMHSANQIESNKGITKDYRTGD